MEDFRCVGIDRYGDPSRLSNADIVVNDLSETDLVKLRRLLQSDKETVS